MGHLCDIKKNSKAILKNIETSIWQKNQSPNLSLSPPTLLLPLLIALQHDFTEALTIIHNEEPQSNHFVRSVNVSIEGYTVHYWHPSDESKQLLDFHGFMSDDTTQMASTDYLHMDMLIQKLMDSKIISKGGRVLSQTYGCAKQYKCATAIYFMSLLATKSHV